MTLKEYLTAHGFRLEKKVEAKLGELISDKYRELYFISAPKINYPEVGLLNNYPPEFLENCTDHIIQFLTPISCTNDLR